jgi:hypothetical protein
MLHRYLRNSLLAFVLAAGAAQADIVVKVAPPKARIEHRVAAPGPGYYWRPGYYRYDHDYVWVPGEWVRPPREHAVWVRPRWVHRSNGWVYVEGRWR